MTKHLCIYLYLWIVNIRTPENKNTVSCILFYDSMNICLKEVNSYVSISIENILKDTQQIVNSS